MGRDEIGTMRVREPSLDLSSLRSLPDFEPVLVVDRVNQAGVLPRALLNDFELGNDGLSTIRRYELIRQIPEIPRDVKFIRELADRRYGELEEIEAQKPDGDLSRKDFSISLEPLEDILGLRNNKRVRVYLEKNALEEIKIADRTFWQFDPREFLGRLEGANIYVAINASPYTRDGGVIFIPGPVEINGALIEPRQDSSFISIQDLSIYQKMSGNGWAITENSRTRSMPGQHFLGMPEDQNGQTLLLAKTLRDESNIDYENNLIYLNGQRDEAIRAIVLDDPKKALRLMQVAEKLGYQCDLAFVAGKIIVLPKNTEVQPSYHMFGSKFANAKRIYGEEIIDWVWRPSGEVLFFMFLPEFVRVKNRNTIILDIPRAKDGLVNGYTPADVHEISAKEFRQEICESINSVNATKAQIAEIIKQYRNEFGSSLRRNRKKAA